MKPVTIGNKMDEHGDVARFRVDVPTLLRSRLLVQAASGGGKTRTLRKILESTFGLVQHIVLDIEGEFSTLRTMYDYVLVGEGGDKISADPRHAETLAKKVLELEVSVIINLYELKPHERVQFVKRFLNAMINAPKELWHPCLVVLDEAHLFAPEKVKAESLGAVIDMASRGRKRGFCLIPATQRPAKLSKDVAAECQNKLIGLANIDIDRKRGAEELGLTSKESVLSLRDLSPGEFYAVGPAFGKGLMKVMLGPVKTPDQVTGKKSRRTIPPTKAVKQILAKLTDLPQEAEQELQDKQAMLARIKELERQLKKPKVEVKTETKVKVEKIVDPKAIKAEVVNFKRYLVKNVDKSMRDFQKSVMSCFDEKGVMGALSEKPVHSQDPRIKKVDVSLPVGRFAHRPPVARSVSQRPNVEVDGRTFGKCERAILKFLAMREGTAFNKTQIGAMTQYSPGSGGFNNALSSLAQAGLIERHSDRIQINLNLVNRVKEILGSDYTSPEIDARIGWLQKLGKCERTIFELINQDENKTYSKDELGELTSYSPGSGGFNNAISRLSTLGLIQRNSDGTIGLNQELVGL